MSIPYRYILTACLALLPGLSATATMGAEEESPPQAVQVYQCDGLDFTVEIIGKEAWIFLPDFSGALPQVESASGSRYEGNNITFWSKGDEASLSYGKQQFQNCRNNPALAVWEKAKLSGVDFRAVGNEPSWVLEIRADQLWLFQDYGAKQTQFDNAEHSTDEATATTTYRAEGEAGDIVVKLKGGTCQDTMADQSYETSVTVEFDGQSLKGCGKALH